MSERKPSPARLIREIARVCAEKGLTAATAESCTGGMIAAAITACPGASGWFRGGVVSYAIQSKEVLLGVDAGVLSEKGPVCADVARQMAVGAARRLSADVAVSVTGLAGPGGDSERGIPQGTVYIGWCASGESGAERFQFPGSRAEVRRNARDAALGVMLRELRRFAIGASS